MSDKHIVIEKHYYHHRVNHQAPRPELQPQQVEHKDGLIDHAFNGFICLAGLVLGGFIASGGGRE